MEFWGVEVKVGQPLKVKPDIGRVIHISQAALGEGKKAKGNDLIPLRVNINGEKFVVGSLSGENFPQVTFDLVFEKEFELSHDWKNGSVYFCGYTADNPFPEEEDDFDSDSDEEAIPLVTTENGKVEPKVEALKPATSKGKNAKPESSTKSKVTVVEPKKVESDENESDEDEDESDDDEAMMDASDDIDDSEDEDDLEDEEDSEDEETPKKAKASKKRPTESATKTPVPAKKPKIDTPQKTDGKKGGGGHTATPHPAKQAAKTPANSNNKGKEQSPKSDGKVSCKSCNKTFNSEGALQSHTKAKHAGK
ncbi:histone deacetylase HDT1-like [Diospyros lotus]|uniref:histone deacetylase HDT1-like n=1 Tax=Diospyros lotus TaxID=55363 RepID=UPI00225B9F18|nr:histone deacetylase HDT1-like [Diospyros lotus]